MNITEYIAGQLVREGVRFVFGIPGGPSITYIEAFRKAGIEFILTANESSAGIMADVTARLTGVPGVCHATFGPGATNILTGVGGALLDRSPVIVLTSEVSDDMAGRTTQMKIDHQKLFAPVTKATFRLDPGNAAEALEKAFRICREEYPGPVHIGLPSDIAGKEIKENREHYFVKEDIRDNNDNEKISSLLALSRRPLLAIGLTAKRLGIKDKLLTFLGTYKMPLVITPMAKGIIPETHPSYTGVLFHALSDRLEDIYERTDLVIGLGYDPVEYNYESWMPYVPLIHLNSIRTDLPERENMFQFTGQPDEWFRILCGLNSGSLISEHGIIRGIRDEMRSVFDGFTNHFGPVTALRTLHEELPEDSIVTADVGSHLHLAGQIWETGNRGTLIMTNGWSGMGFGLPAAMAAKMNTPRSTVACITGDGGFLMQAGEIITARRHDLHIIIVVLSDGELNLIKLKQEWNDIKPCGSALYQGDLFGAGIFLGCRVLYADSVESMGKAVRQALSMNGPVIINARIDPEDYKWLIVRQ
ncbi:MAG: thiamine pyrophosphate-binding protein [Bacteroidota bacterium]